MPQWSTDAKTLRMRGDYGELFQFTPTGRCFLVGRSIRTDLAVLHVDAVYLAATGTGVLMVGLVLVWWIASPATRPLIEISRTAQHIAAGDLSQRIHLAATDDEISDVTDVLNETFARLEDAFERQKQFTADASHELRTPVFAYSCTCSRCVAARAITGRLPRGARRLYARGTADEITHRIAA